MDECNLLNTYKYLVEQQALALDIEEEEQLLDELDKLWCLMSPAERIEAERYITETLPH